MEELNIENILNEDEIADLFGTEELQEETPDKTSSENEENKDENNEESAEINPEEIFGESESVGSEDNNEGTEDTDSTKSSSSPNFYSSIANALVEDGIFQNLTDEDISKIQSAEDFAELFKQQQEQGFTERQKRVEEALNYGVEPTEIQKYERLLNFLGNITNEVLESEEQAGENLRKNLIYQDYINRGFSKERALKEVDRSLKAGTDIDDAKEALQGNKEYYGSFYQALVKEAMAESEKVEAENKKQVEELRDAIMNNEIVFGDIKVDKATRQRVYNNVMNPSYKDPDTGENITALQKYSSEHRVDFLKNVGLIYTLTDGFTNLDKLVGSKVKKEMKKGLRELEKTINHTSRTTTGSLKFASGVSDPESKSSKWDLDI